MNVTQKQLVTLQKYNSKVSATSTFLQVPVPVVQIPVQVPVLGMQVQVQVPVPENCT